ncbi:hypothetical protein H0V99_03975 [Candidatus Saccharibacteria bacterium]|nr:hypothetical protein [Candidatus Saccharibacteria bacterium]
MSLADKNNSTANYFEEATRFRQDVVYVMGSLGLSKNGSGVCVHRLRNYLPASSIKPEGSRTDVLMINFFKRTVKNNYDRPDIHIVTNEVLPDSENGTSSTLVKHFCLPYTDEAKLRVNAELRDREGIQNNKIAKPLMFFVVNDTDFRYFAPAMADIYRRRRDDVILNVDVNDMLYALDFGKTVLSTISTETLIHHFPLEQA